MSEKITDEDEINDEIAKESEEIENIVNAKYAKCSYAKCKNRKECQYFNAEAEIDNKRNRDR